MLRRSFMHRHQWSMHHLRLCMHRRRGPTLVLASTVVALVIITITATTADGVVTTITTTTAIGDETRVV